ncbi:MAG: hypothetical protein GY788_12315, partial [bacterium]|nr:hypothetical protein [bacterium]
MRRPIVWIRRALALALCLVGVASVFSPDPALALDWEGSVEHSYDDSLISGAATTASAVDLRVQPILASSSLAGHLYDSSANFYATNT